MSDPIKTYAMEMMKSRNLQIAELNPTMSQSSLASSVKGVSEFALKQAHAKGVVIVAWVRK